MLRRSLRNRQGAIGTHAPCTPMTPTTEGSRRPKTKQLCFYSSVCVSISASMVDCGSSPPACSHARLLPQPTSTTADHPVLLRTTYAVLPIPSSQTLPSFAPRCIQCAKLLNHTIIFSDVPSLRSPNFDDQGNNDQSPFPSSASRNPPLSRYFFLPQTQHQKCQTEAQTFACMKRTMHASALMDRGRGCTNPPCQSISPQSALVNRSPGGILRHARTSSVRSSRTQHHSIIQQLTNFARLYHNTCRRTDNSSSETLCTNTIMPAHARLRFANKHAPPVAATVHLPSSNARYGRTKTVF
jgi:hypothetical protein